MGHTIASAVLFVAMLIVASYAYCPLTVFDKYDKPFGERWK